MILCCLLIVAGCGEKSEPAKSAAHITSTDKIVVTINGSPITLGYVNFNLRSAHSMKLTPEIKRQTVERMIQSELIYQAGIRLGLDKDAKYRMAVEDMRRRMENFKRMEMNRRVYNRVIAEKVKIDPADVKQYFDIHEKQIRTELHLLHLSFTDEVRAQDALEQLKQGRSFEELVEKKYQNATQGRQMPWDLGFLKWNQILPDWQDAVYKLKKGEISGIVHGKRTGFRIFKLLDKRENSDAVLKTMHSSIANRIMDIKVLAAYDRYVKNLRDQATIVKGDGWTLLDK